MAEDTANKQTESAHQTIDRRELKKQAKKLLDQKTLRMTGFLLLYILMLLLCFVIGFVIPNPLEIAVIDVPVGRFIYLYLFGYGGYYDYRYVTPTALEIISGVGLGCLFVAFRLLVFSALSYPFTVCWMTIPLAIVEGKEFNWHTVLSPISRARYYIECMIMGALRFALTAVWALLFIVPGVMAIYRYSLMPFIFCKNNEQTSVEAMAKSKRLVNGYKEDLFLRDMSFLGWAAFGICTCGVILIYAACYHAVVQALYYKAIEGFAETETAAKTAEGDTSAS